MKVLFSLRLGFVFVFSMLNNLSIQHCFSQCSPIDFTAPVSACLGQSLEFIPSGSYSNYEWDFCPGELSQTPAASVLVNSFGGYGFKVELAEQNGSYYGFILGRATSKLYRLDFGSDVNNSNPTVVNLGGLGVNSSTWHVIEVVEEDGLYYGFISDDNLVYRISFGNSLMNTPTPAQVIFSGTPISTPIDMVVVEEGSSKYIFIANLGNEVLVRLKFNMSYMDTPVLLNPITVAGANKLSGISFYRECDVWYCIATAIALDRAYKLVFTAGIEDPSPTSTFFSLSGGASVSVVQDNDQYYAFVQSQNSSASIFRVNFGNSLANAPSSIDDLKNFGYPVANLWALSMYKVKSDWLVMTVDGSGPNIYKVKFPGTCFSSTQYSTLATPVILATTAGNYKVALRVKDSQGHLLSKSHTIQVNNLPAPDIDFGSQNVCANNNINFTSVNNSGNLNSYLWNFGDATTSSNQNPSHVYASASVFPIKLTVGASNGCNNFVQKSLKIYNAPVADFALPTVSPICTNQNYLLSNSSTSDTGSNPTWEWRLNGTLVSTQKDFTTTFTPVAQDIRLKALIPGCENEKIKTIPVVSAGPSVNFSASDNCQGNSVSFANTSTNADAGYVWTFDDGSSSTIASPSHIYLTPNTFQVKLTASNSAGCQNFLTKPLKIYSLPQPGFSVTLPPFTCSNSSTPFQNTTPALTDSNITTWNWQFGVPGSTSTLQQPSYTYASAGNYNVVLTATSDKTCTATLTKSVVIAASATADFSSGPSCINQSTKFTDASTGSIAARSWTIGTGTFATTNPSYTFTSSGSFPTTLNVTSPNGCINIKTKSTLVPVVPTQNFSMSNPCARKSSAFTDATSSPMDGVTAWNWNFDGNSATGNPTQFIFDVQGIFTTKLTTTHTSGCKYTLSKDVLINPSPTAGFTASPDRGGPPLTVQFINTSQQANSYAWKFFDKVTATSTRISPIYTFASLGNYSAELTATNTQGCLDVFSAPIIVLVPSIDLILKDFSLVNDAVTGKQKGQVTIFNNSNVPIVSAEVSMFLADKSVVNETVTLNLNPGQVVSKTLSFTLSSDQFDFSYLCAKINSEKDIQQDNNKRCINLKQTDHFFRPYPNPSVGTLYVDWISENSGSARLIVYDSMGKKSYEWETPAQAGLNQSVLDLTFLTCGMYYISIETSGGKSSTRFIRQ